MEDIIGYRVEMKSELQSLKLNLWRNTLQGTNISPQKWHFEDDFPFPKVGYVNFLEGKPIVSLKKIFWCLDFFCQFHEGWFLSPKEGD